MPEQEKYRKIAKNTAVLGGSQIVQMLVALARTKVVAVLLGPAGMGVNALILSAISIIQQLSSLGIFQSGVRDLSSVYNSGDAIRFARLRKIFNRLTLFSGLLGLVICLFMSPLLSHLSFGDGNYTWSFAAVSLTLFFMSLQSGKTTILQATQNLKLIAKATIMGAILNLAITIPMFYLWGMNGIVPAIIGSYMIFYMVNKYYESRIRFANVKTPSKVQIIASSKPILKLGIALMVSSLMMVSFTFLLNGFISHFGSVSDVGLFQSASAICMQSMVIINVTLVSDYYPRLSAVCSDKHRLCETVYNQTEIMVFVVAPISIILIAFAPWVISLLLSSEFIPIVPLVQTMALAFGFRLIWIILGLVILAKGDKINYFIYDVIIGNGLNFIFNIIAYYYYGLNGLGISYIVGSMFMMLILLFFVYKQYKISLPKNLFLLFILMFTITLFAYISTLIFTGLYYYLSLMFSVSIIVCGSFYQLNKKLGLINLINSLSKHNINSI